VTFLIDVNLLIAILDPDHVHHDLALGWFNDTGCLNWATCPIVQNGVVRIVGSRAYASVPFGCAEVAKILAEWCAVPEHRFWPDAISLLDAPAIDRAGLTSPDRVTDVYLLALAAANGGQLATLDRRLSPTLVQGGAAALHLVH
jgi:uncharacterized protein